MISPTVPRLLNLYAREGRLRQFVFELEVHKVCGLVIDEPDCQAFVRPIRSDWPRERWATVTDCDHGGDTWFIWAFAGDIRRLLEHNRPYRNFVAYARDGRLRFRRVSAFEKRLGVAPPDLPLRGRRGLIGSLGQGDQAGAPGS